MHLDLIQTLSLAGDAGTPNDDRAGCGERLAWVIDGATDLGPPGLLGERGGAAWLAGTASAAFAAAEPPLEDACARVFGAVERRYQAERRREPIGAWELPSAALFAVAIEGSELAFGWAGDCAALLRTRQGVRWLGEPPDRAAESAAAAAVGAGRMKTPAVIEDRRVARARPGRPVLGVDAAASAPAMAYSRAAVAPGDALLLMSDGFSALVDAYRAHTPETMFAVAEVRGLAALSVELRAIEADDADCARFARFKASDDATALLLRIA